MSFNKFPDGCCIKNAKGPTAPNPVVKFYTKNVPYPVPNGFTYKDGIDAGGNDIECIGGGSFETCRDKCINNPNCMSFNKFPGGCCIKNVKGPTAPNPVVNFYTKDVPYPVPNGFTYKDGLDAGGHDIECIGGGSFETCRDKCINNPDCMSFNKFPGGCCTKNAKGPLASNPAVNFYSKDVPYPVPNGFTYTNGIDAGGNDIECIGGGSFETCRDKCIANSACKSFNKFPGGCCIKHAKEPINVNTDVNFYSRN